MGTRKPKPKGSPPGIKPAKPGELYVGIVLALQALIGAVLIGQVYLTHVRYVDANAQRLELCKQVARAAPAVDCSRVGGE